MSVRLVVQPLTGYKLCGCAVVRSSLDCEVKREHLLQCESAARKVAGRLVEFFPKLKCNL